MTAYLHIYVNVLQMPYFIADVSEKTCSCINSNSVDVRGLVQEIIRQMKLEVPKTFSVFSSYMNITISEIANIITFGLTSDISHKNIQHIYQFKSFMNILSPHCFLISMDYRHFDNKVRFE